MNTQNILQNYGSRLDIVLDSSEYYDYDLGSNDLTQDDREYKDFTYEIEPLSGLTEFGSIQIDEFDNRVYDTGYTYSGLTFVFTFSGFTEHFDYSGHSYSNIYLNNDTYTYVGITGETHYFEIHDFYSGNTTYVDPQLSGTTIDEVLTGFTSFVSGQTDPSCTGSGCTITGHTSILPCTEQLSPDTGTCCPTEARLSNLPWVYLMDHGGGDDNCDWFVQRRPEKGFMLDYVFNRNDLPWSDGNIFFYSGVRDENEVENYADNNLSFGFDSEGRVVWKALRYSGYCSSDVVSTDPVTGTTYSGWTPIYYVDSGSTEPLCLSGTSEDFNVTITFERYYPYSGCSLANEGGWNDLIVNNSTIENNIYEPNFEEELSENWLDERWKRLGTLKIYLNGRPVYKLEDWEEVIMSDRGFQPFAHAQGGGVTGCEGIHEGVCEFEIKYVGYLEDVMTFPDIRERYLTVTSQNFNIIECNSECVDDLENIIPTPTPSLTPSLTPSITVSPSITPSISASPAVSPSVTPTITPSASTL